MNDFNQKYINYSNSELLKIIDCPNDYQSLAVQTAKNILESRHLTDQEIEIAKKEIAAQQQQKAEQNQKKKDIENKVKDWGNNFIDTINPIQTTIRTTDKTILITSIVLGLLTIKKYYQEFGSIKWMLTDNESHWDLSTLIYFFPLIMLPFGTILFWKRKKTGWSLLTIYLTYVAIGAIISFALELNTKPTGISAMDNLFSKTSPLIFVWSLIFNGGILLLFCKDNIRTVYGIDKSKMFTSIGIALALTILTMVGIFM